MTHASGHSHEHGMPGHAHGTTDERRLAWAFWIIAAFMLLEMAGGALSGSLALLADAGHMASDAAALAFSWLAIRMGRRSATRKLTYGYRRLEVLAAFVNGVALFAIAAWITIEAVHRIMTPSPVLAGPMLLIAVAGLGANVAAFLVLYRGSHENLNLRSAMLHVIGDLLGSVAAIAAAVIILFTGWTLADPILSVLVALIILRSAQDVVRKAGHILLEGAPAGLDLNEVRVDLEQNVPQMASAHHIHAWSITPDTHVVTLHATPAAGTPATVVIRAIHERLKERFGVHHVTVQVEDDGCVDQGSHPADCG